MASKIPFLSSSEKKPAKLTVFAIDECNQCKLKTKRSFKIGDYVHKGVGECQSCKGKLLTTMIYGEPAKTS